jgi:hypothetical protein
MNSKPGPQLAHQNSDIPRKAAGFECLAVSLPARHSSNALHLTKNIAHQRHTDKR